MSVSLPFSMLRVSAVVSGRVSTTLTARSSAPLTVTVTKSSPADASTVNCFASGTAGFVSSVTVTVRSGA